eukprot:m.52116 g.52116  ORF g.52116 m.52116 type:complete len:511 (+) comp15300_c0_seq1:141-1673(+)
MAQSLARYLLLAALVGSCLGKIEDFSSPGGQTTFVFWHTESLFASNNSRIEFTVNCDETVNVIFEVVSTDIEGIDLDMSVPTALCDPPQGNETDPACPTGVAIVLDRAGHYWGELPLLCTPDSPVHYSSETGAISEDSFYTLYIEAYGDIQVPKLSGSCTFRNAHGYLPASLYPLWIFYGVMGLAYLLVGIFWLGLMGYHYADLLKLQIWIAIVVFIGLVEMAFLYGDLEYLNVNGRRSHFLMILSCLLTATKNTLARLLVLVVSMGFGVVKPRLGDAFKQIVVVGCAFFFFSAAFYISQASNQTQTEQSKVTLMVVVPLSVLDACILWWIFLSLSHTIKMLTLRRNEAKLNLYVRFRNALALCVVGTAVFGIWYFYDLYGHSDKERDWRNEWWYTSYWHLLFFAVLITIMYLWRPSNNNKRYAYTALETDLEEDPEVSVVPHFGEEAMKMRVLSSRSNATTPKPEVEDDLKWVEENIPTSVIANSNAFNFPMDSDEETLHTNFELSKME